MDSLLRSEPQLPDEGDVEQGANSKEILQAGGWKSKAFLAYVDQNALEEEAVLNHGIAGSDDEE